MLDLSAAWREALGPDWAQSQEEWLHRLGNLTLTGYNPELSDRPFLDKRDHQEGGFRTSPLRLNQGLGQLERWDVDAMRQRGETLAARALDVWASPQLSEEQRQAYRQPSRSQVAVGGTSVQSRAVRVFVAVQMLFEWPIVVRDQGQRIGHARI